MSGSRRVWEGQSPERLYVIAGGQRAAAETPLDLVTLIVARSEPRPGMQPEHLAILRLCSSPLSVVEIAAHLGLPVSVITVLLGDLLADGDVEARAPARVRRAQLPDIAIVETVMDGLRKL
ncbi:DUF742 domain-containing protein [Streptomyces pathocidini]|uniref:DUF742 domain-containing protein n=1 Tax=Streptomyces pathocidini TaxID=1650571 RepID=A0ABW7UR16_9ACTN|nr:DUF742 domain-containing protein [Streptomyces pathocidini]